MSEQQSNRDLFLRSEWQRFPPAPSPIISVGDECDSVSSRFADIESLWIGGRIFGLRRSSAGWSFNLTDARIAKEFHFMELKLLSSWQPKTRLGRASRFLAEEVVRDGDQVAIRAETVKKPSRADLLLLAPSMAEPLVCGPSPQVIADWQRYLNFFRQHFLQLGFDEIGTPSLVRCPGLEVHLEPFKTEFICGQNRAPLFLPTSPELHLKKLLSRNWQRIFEMRSVFRNGEISAHHQPEFKMAEWYRLYGNESHLIEDLEAILVGMKKAGLVAGELLRPIVVNVKELFARHLNVNLTADSEAKDLYQVAEALGLGASQDESFDELFHRLWLEKIEPWIQSEPAPILVRQWPRHLASLARIESGWAERVELYWRGLEIANGFVELNDPEEQLQRFQRDIERRKHFGRMAVPIDDDFMNALRSGQPPSAGMALGLERLWMAAQSIHDIQQIRLFAMR